MSAFAQALPALSSTYPVPARPRVRTLAVAAIALFLLMGLAWTGTLRME